MRDAKRKVTSLVRPSGYYSLLLLHVGSKVQNVQGTKGMTGERTGAQAVSSRPLPSAGNSAERNSWTACGSEAAATGRRGFSITGRPSRHRACRLGPFSEGRARPQPAGRSSRLPRGGTAHEPRRSQRHGLLLPGVKDILHSRNQHFLL